jgi:hypothetical protein
MAPGWLKKIGNFFRKVGTWIKNVFVKAVDIGKKVWDVGKPIVAAAITAKTGNPQAAMGITSAIDAGVGIVDKLRQNIK